MGVRNWLGKLFDPNVSSEELAMKVVIKGGYLGERIDVVESIGNPENKEVWGGQHNKITLPWLDIANKRDNFDRVDAFQDMLNRLERIKNNGDDKDNEGAKSAARKINQIAKQCGTLVVGFSMTDPEDMKNIILSKPYIIDMNGGQGRFFDPSQGRQGGEKSAGFDATVKRK
jgi:hypothetical protein